MPDTRFDKVVVRKMNEAPGDTNYEHADALYEFLAELGRQAADGDSEPVDD